MGDFAGEGGVKGRGLGGGGGAVSESLKMIGRRGGSTIRSSDKFSRLRARG